MSITHHVQRLEYSKLRVTRQYENDRATATIELVGMDSMRFTEAEREVALEAAILEGKRVCDKALKLVDTAADQALVTDAMKTETGKAAVKEAAERVLRNRRAGYAGY